jgi:hypothetical protein
VGAGVEVAVGVTVGVLALGLAVDVWAAVWAAAFFLMVLVFLADVSTAVLAGAEAAELVECEALVPPHPAAARAIKGMANSARFKRNLPSWFALSYPA